MSLDPKTAAALPLIQSLGKEELIELLSLIGGADTVELKLTIPDASRRATVEALDLDPLDAQIRQVYFFDTPELALNEAGLVVRARRSQGRDDDSVVKLRPVVPAKLSSESREAELFGVEVDAMPGGFVCSASFKGKFAVGRVKEAAAGTRPIEELFSKEQRAFYAEHAPDGIGFGDLSILGPILVLKLKNHPQGFERKLVTELWLYPDGSMIFELSTKCAPNEAFEVAASSRAYLEELGVDLTGEQATKTKTALEFFTKNAG
jgi:hypothetical protein